MRLEGDLALTRTWLTEGLPAVAEACKRLAIEATSLGLEHYASIALHNLGYILVEMGRPTEAIMHLERAARFWADLPPNPFADFSDLVRALATTGDFDRAHLLADTATDKTRSWPRPFAEATYGKAAVLALQGRFADAVESLQVALENPSALGALGRIIIGGLLVDCLYMASDTTSGMAAALSVMNQGPLDSRYGLTRSVANALGNHTLGTCSGDCQMAWREVSAWSDKGLLATSVTASIKLAHLAFEHRSRNATKLAGDALQTARHLQMLKANKWWTRLLAPHAMKIARQRGGAQLLRTLVESDPEGWRVRAIDALPTLQGEEREGLLIVIVQNANRETAAALEKVAGSDVSDAVRTLVVRQAPRLYIRLFGALSVQRGSPEGPTIPISKRRLRTMVGLLAAHLGRPLSRDQVIETLWPDADITAGLNNFNQTIFQLRRELDSTHRDGETPPYVVSTVESVYLHPELVRADVGDVRRLASRLSTAPLGLKRETAEKLLALVRGEFLFDLRYEDWTPSIQLRVHAEVRSFLAPLLMADGIEISHETGVRAALAVIGLDEYDETAQFALIRQLAASGKREAARVAAARYISRLRSELDEEPGPELSDLLATVGRR